MTRCHGHRFSPSVAVAHPFFSWVPGDYITLLKDLVLQTETTSPKLATDRHQLASVAFITLAPSGAFSNMLDVDKGLERVRHVLLKGIARYDGGDGPRTMTNSRLFARFLSRYRWYYPAQEGGPSLEAAWDHYEHVTLARYFTDEDPQAFVRAPQGEKQRKTELYPLWGTPIKELMDFGISVRMYFSTLLVLAGFMALAGVFNTPIMIYFWNYGTMDGVDSTVRASAICDTTEWVACESCNTEYAAEYPEYRLDGNNVRRNTCNFEDWLVPGLWSYAASILLLVLFGFAFFWVQRKAEIVFDEEVQTASDYSIKIRNPPPDAIDPEEWRAFLGRFSQKGVTHLTIALDNAKLVAALVKRRKLLRKLSRKLPLGTAMTDDDAIATTVMEAGKNDWISLPFFPGAKQQYSAIQNLEKEIKGLLQRDYRAVAVFATFETERGQRDALHALSTGKLNVWWNRINTSRFTRGNKLIVRESSASSSLWDLAQVLKEDEMETRVIHLPQLEDSGSSVEKVLMFRGRQVLNVKEACEPTDVRWQDLESSTRVQLAGYIGTTFGMIVFVSWSGIFVHRLVKQHPGTLYATMFITITNVIVPLICDFINSFESHSTEGQRQTSLFAKIALFRWFNSAIVLSIISHFIETISVEDGNEVQKGSLAYKVYPVIFAEMFFTPLILMMDVVENFRKHILAPRARDQEEMNSYFTGTQFELVERYTDATKVMFVALFFSSILPEAFFLAAAALLMQYIVAKFCLLRLWRASPDIGFRLARLSRNYFFSASLVAHMVMSAYWWSGFPYDNVCEDNGEYVYCNQNFFAARIFPPLPRFQPEGMEWMSDSQEMLTSLYGWTSLVVIIMALLAVLYQVVLPTIKSLFFATYEPDGADQGIDFSSVKHLQEMHGYIPQIRDPDFLYPLLACELLDIDEDLVGWNDPVRGFHPHNLVNDAYQIMGGRPLQPVFSIVRQWTPDAESKQKVLPEPVMS